VVDDERFSTDPRPAGVDDEGTWRVPGRRCPACGYRSAHQRPRCPRCAGPLEATAFGPAGTVWSSTVVRVPVPGRTPPYVLAYVDLDEGPRVLAHVAGAGATAPPIGSTVHVSGVGAHGDLEVEPA